MKTCSTCKETKNLDQFYPDKYNRSGYRGRCKSCDLKLCRKYQNSPHGFLVKMLQDSKKSAKGREGDASSHNIDIQFLETQWELQSGLCYYSGIPMIRQQHSSWQASLERLNPLKGYVPGNVVFCVLELNHKVQWTKEKITRFLEEHDNPRSHELATDEKPVKSQQTGIKKPALTHNQRYCSACKLVKDSTEFSPKSTGWCRPCAAEHHNRYRRTLNGYAHIILSTSKYNTKTRANKSSRTGEDGHTLTADDIVDQYKSQNGRCAYSGIPLSLEPGADWSISLERLDSEKGYHKDNIALVVYELNTPERSRKSRYTKKTLPDDFDTKSGGWTKHKVEFFVESLRKKLAVGAETIDSVLSEEPCESTLSRKAG